MMVPVRFDVVGLPVQQGSKVPGVTRNGKPYLRESNDAKLRPWRADVAAAARDAIAGSGQPALTGPVRLTVLFRFPMPKSRPRWAHEAGIVLMSVSPDLDKLARAVGDSCTQGGVIGDDATVALLNVGKFEVASSWTGASIMVEPLDPLSSRVYAQAMSLVWSSS